MLVATGLAHPSILLFFLGLYILSRAWVTMRSKKVSFFKANLTITKGNREMLTGFFVAVGLLSIGLAFLLLDWTAYGAS